MKRIVFMAIALTMVASQFAMAHPVQRADEAPPEFHDYSAEAYQKILQDKTPEQFIEDLIASNGGAENVREESLEVSGTIRLTSDEYYITFEDGTPVSVSISSEDEGAKFPSYSHAYRGNDWICFFQGEHAGTCGRVDRN